MFADHFGCIMGMIAIALTGLLASFISYQAGKEAGREEMQKENELSDMQDRLTDLELQNFDLDVAKDATAITQGKKKGGCGCC